MILVIGQRLEDHSIIFLAIQTHLSRRFLLAVDFPGLRRSGSSTQLIDPPQELRLARIQLRRSLKAKRTEEISVFLRRVERLEATRAAMADKGHETMDAREAARQIWQAVREIDELTIIPPPPDF